MNDELNITEIVGEPAAEYAVVDMSNAGSLANELPDGVQFDMLASGGASTVCATTPLVEHDSGAYQSEAALEEAFIAQLQRQAYERVNIHNEEELVANLRTQLETLNSFSFTNAEWQRFFTTVIASTNDSITEKTRRIQEGDSVQLLERDDGSHFNIKLIDKRNIHNNRLQVLNQYTAEGGTHENRYDVTILVNGLPLVHVELKRRGVPIREAFNQIERYKRDSFWSGCGLYEYVQIFIISNGTHTKYYSNTTRDAHIKEYNGKKSVKKTSHSFEFTNWWADASNAPIQDLMPFTKTFLAKHTILNMLTCYCVFNEDQILLVMRPYQVVATEAILNRILVSENNRNMLGTAAAGGYIWHTTGSGKTLTSFKTAQLATQMEGVDKVLFVVDRKDLDYQTMREYDKFARGAANGNTSTAVLTRQMEDPSARILVTTIQKLAVFIKKNPSHDIYGKHVVIIFDECHRSQFGEMHTAITKHFKNYHLFGFTGTPIFAENASGSGNVHLRTTEQAFGDKLHTYTIVDAIRDGNVLPFRIDYNRTVAPDEGMKDEQVYNIQRQAALMDPRRIHLITKYILEHFNLKTKRNTGAYQFKRVVNVGEVASTRRGVVVEEIKENTHIQGFNSILAVASIDMAKLYYSEFKRQQAERPGPPLKIGLIYSFGPNEADDGSGLPDESFDTESLDTPSREFLEDAIADYNAMFKVDYDTSADKFQNYYKDVSLRMKNCELDLLIVVNMFLTGFDATTLNTLWVDKDLKLHGLIQAFSRTNRILNSVKTYGNIICFRNLEDEVNKAISLFGDRDAGGIVLLKPYEEYLGEYAECLAELKEQFPPGEVILGEEAQRAFIRLFGTILRLRNILLCFDEFAEDDTLVPYDEQNYRSVYADLYDEFRKKKEDAAIVNDDLVFEIELIRQVDVNIDYILMLVQKYHDDNCQDTLLIGDVKRAIAASYDLRNKRDLIEQFIDSLDTSNDVHADWERYIAAKKEEELATIISEENLDDAATRDFLDRAFRFGGIPEGGTDVVGLMLEKKSRFAPTGEFSEQKQRLLERLKIFFDRFKGMIAE